MVKTVLIFNLLLGTAFADSSLPTSYSQEVAIWPEGSKVLADGIKEIEKTKDLEHKNKTPKEIAAKELNADIKISKEIPPTLLVDAKDDPVDPVHYSEVYERELKKVGVNVQLLLYKTGGHAFGVKRHGKDTDRWTTDALEWLKEIEML